MRRPDNSCRRVAAFNTVYGHGVGGAFQAVNYQPYLHKYNAPREKMAGYVLTAHDAAQDRDQRGHLRGGALVVRHPGGVRA